MHNGNAMLARAAPERNVPSLGADPPLSDGGAVKVAPSDITGPARSLSAAPGKTTTSPSSPPPATRRVTLSGTLLEDVDERAAGVIRIEGTWAVEPASRGLRFGAEAAPPASPASAPIPASVPRRKAQRQARGTRMRRLDT
jgi:hypothetical protein